MTIARLMELARQARVERIRYEVADERWILVRGGVGTSVGKASLEDALRDLCLNSGGAE